MAIKESWVCDSLKDIRNIIIAEGDSCNYDALIGDVVSNLNNLNILLENAESEAEIQRIMVLREKAQLYLKTLKSLQKSNQSNAEPQPESGS